MEEFSTQRIHYVELAKDIYAAITPTHEYREQQEVDSGDSVYPG